QQDFVSRGVNQGGSPDNETLYLPVSVYYNGHRLYIADGYNNRILIYNGIPTTNNVKADEVLGQDNFYSNSDNQGGTPYFDTLHWPNGIFYDGEHLFIADRDNNRVIIRTLGASGLYTSAAIDSGASDSTWNYITATTTLATSTSIEFATRTSDDNSTWSDWATSTLISQTNISRLGGVTATSSSYYGLYVAGYAIDGRDDSPWAPEPGQSSYSLDIDFGEKRMVGRVEINCLSIGGQDYYADDYAIYGWSGSDWVQLTATTTGNTSLITSHSFTATSTSKIRLFGTGANPAITVPAVTEFKIYPGIANTETAYTFTPTSPAARYLQYRAVLSTTNTSVTPTLSAINANYFLSTPADSTPPTIDTKSPLASATKVATTTTITALFSEPMATSTLTTTTFTLAAGATPISGTVEYSGLTATFTPDSPLSYNTTYTATVTTGAADLASNGLAENNTWTFTTDDRPAVSSISPANGNNNAAISTTIAATFSEDMATSSITTSTFTVRDSNYAVSGSVSYANSRAVFTPSRELDCTQEYTVTLTTGITDINGNAMSANYTSRFMTGCSSSGIAPTVTGETTTTVTTATDSGETTTNPEQTATTETVPATSTGQESPSSPSAISNEGNGSSPASQSATNTGEQASTSSGEQGSFQMPTLEITENLTPGETNREVSILKGMLKDLNYLPADTDITDNTYDQTTKEAVTDFQGDNGIDQTGYVGPKTRAALNSAWLAYATNQAAEAQQISNQETGTTAEQTPTPEEENNTVTPTVKQPTSITEIIKKQIYPALIIARKQIASSTTAAVTTTALAVTFITLSAVQFAGQVNTASQVPSIFLNLFGFVVYRRRRRAGLV
ncbi:MAG: Ig-like domain-containing protein, partial [Methanothrix sp.]|nr:Ig-like domain-containing protein [Methanothrix sp.]